MGLGVTLAQVVLRRGFRVATLSFQNQKMNSGSENLSIEGFKLSDADMEKMKSLDNE